MNNKQKVYALTLTLTKYQLSRSRREQFFDSARIIFKSFSPSCYFMMYPELTIEGNVHWHGEFEIYDDVKYYNTTIPMLKKLCGFRCMKTIFDKDYWFKYMTKSYGSMNRCLKIPIEYDIRCWYNNKNEGHYLSRQLNDKVDISLIDSCSYQLCGTNDHQELNGTTNQNTNTLPTVANATIYINPDDNGSNNNID